MTVSIRRHINPTLGLPSAAERLLDAEIARLHGAASAPHSGLRLRAARHDMAPGLISGTAARQAEDLVRWIRYECEHSLVFCRTIETLVCASGRGNGAVTLHLGKHSCAFAAAPVAGAMDVDDLMRLPGTPTGGANFTRTELFLHILEARVGRALPPSDPTTWRLPCGGLGSVYRRERGFSEPTATIALTGHGLQGELEAVDRSGNRTRFVGIDTSRSREARPWASSAPLRAVHDWLPLPF